jgi:hypothetical protein
MREAKKCSDQLGEAFVRSDRIPGDNRHSADHLVCDESPLVLVEEIRLVPAQDEGCERVDAPGGDEVTGQPAMARFLCVPVAPGCEPVEQEDSDRADGEEQHRQWEPFAERAGQMAGSARVHANRAAGCLAYDKREGEGLIRHHAIDPERSERVAEDRGAEEQCAQDDARVGLRVARRVEIGSARQQRDGHKARRNRPVTETVLEVECDEPEQDGQCNLPGALLPTRKPARGNEKHEAEWRDECFRNAMDVLRRK